MQVEMVIQVAREALEAHDALVATRESEPDLTLDSDAWMVWHKDIRGPAYDRWSLAMDALSDELDEPAMSRHPSNFRPRCEKILRYAAKREL